MQIGSVHVLSTGQQNCDLQMTSHRFKVQYKPGGAQLGNDTTVNLPVELYRPAECKPLVADQQIQSERKVESSAVSNFRKARVPVMRSAY